MRERKAPSRERLLSLLVERAQALTEKQRYEPKTRRWIKHRTAWPIIQAACFAEARLTRLSSRARSIGPERGISAPLLGVMGASNMGMGARGKRKGARERLAQLLCIAGRLVAWRGGLRLEEMAAAMGVPEEKLWPILQWARKERVFVDLGERGWFIDTPDGCGPGSVAELRRAGAAA